MKLRTLVFLNALAVSLSIGIVNYYFQHSWFYFAITSFISLFVSFIVFYILMEKYVYSKIKIIYKLIHSLKLGKDLKDALGEYVSPDPINDVEQEVKEWAKEKKIEIDELKREAIFRKEFLTNLSHELKTPLFSIGGYLEVLEDSDLTDVEETQRFLKKISNNVDRLSILIKDLDEISKLESGEIPLNIKKFDITVLIKEVLELMELEAEKHHIELLFKQKYDVPTFVMADRDKIRQVLVNLIGNSIKYGKENGTTFVTVFEMHDQILVEVTDNGIGIEEKNLKRLFERFFRTDFSRSRNIGGSGLGLAIVKHIVEAHDQAINVRSTPGIGSTFGFTLQKAKTPLSTIPLIKDL
ncbi:integral membrane sensor signal transduction histidine kinase [Pseudopedobacter saltans DSM 12145]|uniref:histidine kinase n=1 Tax=Pseudopedobacter saltans (strain ATCC 51119 / DSM 12145 / JCM 21818 / CCUG 39354 / LMG 10337 / NBRC 100064 / NCIMB 13643) TaxID=762903 RepID=F0S9H3_PSESL|nr:ATP-binding protein [Pseudopedobacter saltans]ADY53526.1 integral membrane sensor signal transduction histidine kinase [Pseudopedobacter saltans DSM 12145]